MTELIKLNSFSESNIKSLADDICAEIENGNQKAMNAYIQAKALELLSKEVISKIKDYAINEADQYSKNESTLNGASFSLSTSPLQLDFESDTEYRLTNQALKDRRELLTDAYKQFQKNKTLIFDSITGEAIPIMKLKKEQETIIKISFKGDRK